MKKYKLFFISLLMAGFISGCATSYKINQVEIGMTKKEVIQRIGNPNSAAAQKNTEYLRYLLFDNSDRAFMGLTTEYYVRLIDGKVESFGKMGDFDSSQKPSSKIEISGETTNNININKKKNKK